MKKVTFLCCLFCGLITQAVGATYNCKPQYIGDWAFKRSNEYLFVDVPHWEDSEGIALVCGHKGTDGCKHGTIVMISGKYVHKNGEIAEYRLYRCDTKGGSSWDSISYEDLEDCSSTEGMQGVAHHVYDDYKAFVSNDFIYRATSTGDYVIPVHMCKLTMEEFLSRYDPSPESSEEKKTDTTNASETTSEQDIASSDTSGTDVSGTGATGTGTSGAGTSAQTKSGDAGGNAEREWLAPCSQEDLLKVPHAKAGRYIYRTKDEIVCAATECVAGYYLVRNAEGQSQGWCKYGTDPYATTNASETTSGQGASSSDASGTGATGADVTGTATSGTDVSGTGSTGTGTSAQNQSSGGTSGQVQSTAPEVKKSPCELNQSGWILFEGRCITDTQYQNILAERQAAKVRALTQKIESTASQLDSISSNFKVSEWKDAEGKFNTARLASDSIAGVVLGTAGGLITSHVVKKNQVENGFQDIKCTIGGQSVANWGDEFSVGIQ